MTMPIIDIPGLIEQQVLVKSFADGDLFVVGRPNSQSGVGYIWVLMDKQDFVSQILSSSNSPLLVGNSSVQDAINNANAPSASNPFATLTDVQHPASSNILWGEDYGMVAGGSDNTAAFNTFIAACKSGLKQGALGYGNFYFNSKPNDIDFTFILNGMGLDSTVLVRNYSEVGTYTGLLAFVDNSSGSRISNMAIESAAGKTGGSMISAICSSSFAISGLCFENLWLSTFGSNTQNCTLYLNGSSKTTAPTGLRDTSLKNVHVFGANGYSVVLSSVEGLGWFGGGVYPAGGTNAASGGIQIGGTSGNKSNDVTIMIPTSGGLNLTNCDFMSLHIANLGDISGTSVNNDNSCSDTCVYGQPSGTVAGNGVRSGIRRPGAAFSTT